MATYPYEVGFPVKFNSGGDTTKEAFGKHIQEIERIYGLLNGINADKLSAEEFTNKMKEHINSSNPHPNLDLNNTQGNISFSRISGNLDLSRTTGNLPSSRVSGNFDTSRITGLEALINSKISSSAESVESSISGDNGYVKLKGGLVIQWGKTAGTYVGHLYTDAYAGQYLNVKFNKSFSQQCLFANFIDYTVTTPTTTSNFKYVYNAPSVGFAATKSDISMFNPENSTTYPKAGTAIAASDALRLYGFWSQKKYTGSIPTSGASALEYLPTTVTWAAIGY